MKETVLKKTADNALVIANSTDLVADIILKISGNDISNSLNGQQIKRPLICSIAQSEIAKKLAQTK